MNIDKIDWKRVILVIVGIGALIITPIAVNAIGNIINGGTIVSTTTYTTTIISTRGDVTVTLQETQLNLATTTTSTSIVNGTTITITTTTTISGTCPYVPYC